MLKVGLAKGNKSYEAVSKALDLVRDDVHVPNDRPVLIKTNMVSPTVELAATPVDAVRATMSFLTSLGVKKFIVAEGTSMPEGDTMGAFQRFGYFSLKDISRRDVQVLGEDPANCITRYKPFEGMPEILGWYVKDWKGYLHGDYIRSQPA